MLPFSVSAAAIFSARLWSCTQVAVLTATPWRTGTAHRERWTSAWGRSICTQSLSLGTDGFGTLALRRTKRTWSGSVCALQWRASVKYWCWNYKREAITWVIRLFLNDLRANDELRARKAAAEGKQGMATVKVLKHAQFCTFYHKHTTDFWAWQK